MNFLLVDRLRKIYYEKIDRKIGSLIVNVLKASQLRILGLNEKILLNG